MLRIRSHVIVQPKHEFRAAEFQLRVDPRLRSPDGIDAATILVSTTMVKKHKREDFINLYNFHFSSSLSGRGADS